MIRSKRQRPDAEAAHHFETAFCDAVDCGLHIVAYREDNTPICEVVMSAETTLKLMQYCTAELYDKATRKDEGC